jgi:two-component system phosphate regulon sensor histidine kinase PhoR
MIIMFFGTTTTGYLSYRFTKNQSLANLEESLKSECSLVGDNFKLYKGDYDKFARDIKQKIGKRVTIIEESGRVAGESDTSSSKMENHANRPEFQEALKNGEGNYERYSETEKTTMYYYAQKVEKEGRIYIIRLSVQFGEVKNVQFKYLKMIVYSIITGIIICTLLAYFYVNRFTHPIRMLTSLATTIAMGQYEKRINMTSNDEIGRLGHAFNLMAGRLQETVTDLSDKQNKLISILESMDDGVIVVDNFERILIINPAAQRLFGIEGNATGKYFIEVIRNHDMEEIMKMIPEEEIEITMNHPSKKHLRIKATRVINYNENLGVMLFIQDVTKIKTLEQMRSDFVANVSHELRSPLTSIKGFAETLKYVEDKPTRDKFLDIIYVESERLTRLINDILILSELENKDSSINFEKLNVKKSIEEIYHIMEPVAKNKEVALGLNLPNEDVFIYGDRDKFKQMMINLIDNSIKYTNEKGRVLVELLIEGANAKITVEDNGIGIPQENIPRLFERFYRVDKGRSRKMGGTGLGLAIVKHIVMILNGEISVKSAVGQGTSFIIYFPLVETNQK